MQTFSFAPPNLGLGDNKKSMLSKFWPRCGVTNNGRYLILGVDYVFVDEHNRHKRLKGMSPTVAGLSPYIADALRSDESLRRL